MRQLLLLPITVWFLQPLVKVLCTFFGLGNLAMPVGSSLDLSGLFVFIEWLLSHRSAQTELITQEMRAQPAAASSEAPGPVAGSLDAGRLLRTEQSQGRFVLVGGGRLWLRLP